MILIRNVATLYQSKKNNIIRIISVYITIMEDKNLPIILSPFHLITKIFISDFIYFSL